MSNPQEHDPAKPIGLAHPIFNWLSMTGLALAASSLSAIAFFLLIGLVVSDESGYAGLTVVPPLLLALLGFLLTIIGFLRERWRQKHGRHSSFLRQWVLDPLAMVRGTGLAAILLGLVFGTFALLGAGAGSLAVVKYTESTQFCGQVCHQVMGPEATTYAHSAHARIGCVECHVGPGGDSYIRAKLGGLRQLYAMATDTVERPIHTPIRRRRLSREMCESCHTADRMVGYKAISRDYYVSGMEDHPARLRMLVKVGGGGRDPLMPGQGIHYHMLAARKVEYIARDPQRQEIAWVRVTTPKGKVKEFSNEAEPLTEAERGSLEVRVMECVDCHSRPAHRFESPARSVNAAIAVGRIPPTLPRIKEASVRALDGGYATTEAAMAGIQDALKDFYAEEEPEALDGASQKLNEITAVLRAIYRRSIFPEMKADWRTHPDNIGHLESPGCFRCHNDEMVDEDGEAIFTDCASCHAILAQDERMVQTTAQFEEGRSFVHPEDAEPFDEFTLCTDCHTGGADLYD